MMVTLFVCGLTLTGLTLSAHAQGQEAMLGFAPAAAAAELKLEAQFDALISAEEIRGWNETLSRDPHHAGSQYSRQNAEYLAKLFETWGFTTAIDSYYVLLPTPKTREVQLLAPKQYTAGMTEEVVPGDISTTQRDEVIPPYNAFSTDGEVVGELVFVNYGRPEDYELLARYGIDVTGKIAIAKYGKSWRGIKPKLAAEHGAIGTLIYSDPADDGYAQGDVYPQGAFKNATAVQRGSVMDMPTYPGDVQTPGRGATRRANRTPIDQVETITKIPVLPISYQDALPLLAALGGEVVPPTWRGALPITYHLGPGPARVRIKAEFNWDRIEIFNVIARLPGTKYPNEWVIRGNHHDAWNHGAADPISGLAALLAEAQAVGQLAQSGKRPLRTIIYAAWDAEEPGLIGSTEWVEDNAKQLTAQTVAYINTDGNSRGFLGMGGSHTLEKFFDQISTAVIDPQTKVSLDARRRARLMVGSSQEQREDLIAKGSVRLSPLGSGSDYTPFLQHLGIASANLGFGGEGRDGSYHTLYDTHAHYTKFRDPGFVYGVALAQVAGRATLRLANAPILPFRFAPLVENLTTYVTQIEALASTKREHAEVLNKNLTENLYQLALDPRRGLAPPQAEAVVPHFNFAPLKNALAALSTAADAADASIAQVTSEDDVETLNQLLYRSERALTSSEGLPGRKWYRHQIYAPGFYTGYGVKTLPRVREAIEAELYEKVDASIQQTAALLVEFTDYVMSIEAEAQRLVSAE